VQHCSRVEERDIRGRTLNLLTVSHPEGQTGERESEREREGEDKKRGMVWEEGGDRKEEQSPRGGLLCSSEV